LPSAQETASEPEAVSRLAISIAARRLAQLLPYDGEHVIQRGQYFDERIGKGIAPGTVFWRDLAVCRCS
jgi:hypothetical protein